MATERSRCFSETIHTYVLLDSLVVVQFPTEVNRTPDQNGCYIV